jgi:hypothetical protein
MKKERNYLPVMVILVLVVIGIFLWILLRDWHESRVDSARKQESQEWKQRAEVLTRKLTELEQELGAARGEKPSEEKVAEVFGPPAVEAPAREKPLAAEEIERRVKAFFSYLDSRDYVQAYALEGGSYQQYLQAVEALSAQPPRVAGETESLYDMLKNVSYVYRVIGKKRVLVAAEVLEKERDVMEPAMRVFYLWYTGSSDQLKGRPSLPTLYAYASYLLDTFGGRSYLLRRDSRTRLLTTYYCILVVDRANDRQMNPNGIDLRPLIAATARDVRSQTGLVYQKQYLAELERLASKYPN